MMDGRRSGALTRDDGSVQWRVWAPFAERVDLLLLNGDDRRVVPMTAETGEEEGYFAHTESQVADGQLYLYQLDGGEERQDPCSLAQPEGVPGPSAVVRPAKFGWTDEAWKGMPREELVFYELHVGTFTPEGTFEAIIPRLAELRDLGITAIELMPIAQFPGTRNWGYDGVLPYAAQNSYGGPAGLAKLVDAAHAAGLAVTLDVVYNHTGPEASFLREFGPYYTDKYKTPWGSAINYDDKGCDAVRDFVLDNVRMWLEEFHIDGLRLDAVHAIFDMGARHILRAIKEVADEVEQTTGRVKHVVAESDLDDPRIILPPERGGHGLDAQWSDDFHHAAHSFLTGEKRGYYADYGEAEHVAKVLQSPFLYTWDHSTHRGRKHGAPVPEDVGGERFIVCIQNHDQIGNRAAGDRLSTLLGHPAKQRLAATLMLFSPHLPMLFMGDEYGETNPFPFFCSFNGAELTESVKDGRKREFDGLLDVDEAIPDPTAVETFDSARLKWEWPQGSIYGGLRTLYQDLLHARRRWPTLQDYTKRTATLLADESGATVLELVRGKPGATPHELLTVYFNLGDNVAPLARRNPHDVEAILFSSEASRYGGDRLDGDSVDELRPFECVAIGPADWGRLR